ncbi:TetR/AcrR family transcriptional regulator [Frankia sp. Cpl3]|nr:TetR/AcrR family transcriptional regulator [Frankia sp. Cpl3]
MAAARERLLVAATELVARAGWSGASVTAVAAAAEMSVGSVYQHFPSKSALVCEVFRRAAAQEVVLLSAVAAVSVPADLMDVLEAAGTVGGDGSPDEGGADGPGMTLSVVYGGEPGKRLAAVAGDARETARAVGDPVDRLVLAVALFARRALARRGLTHALLVGPSDPAAEVERLIFRRRYRDVFAVLVGEGVEAGILPVQDPMMSATALTGAIGEVVVGPLSMAEELPRDGRDVEWIVRAVVAMALRCVGAGPMVRGWGSVEAAHG